MQKIIKKIYKCRQAIQGVKHKKALFVFFTFVLPCAYYLVLIGYFGLMGLNEDDLPEIQPFVEKSNQVVRDTLILGCNFYNIIHNIICCQV